MRKFSNTSEKVKAVLSVFNRGEKLSIKEIAGRLDAVGYKMKDAHLRMFIYYNMLYQHLKKEEIRGTSHYYIGE